MALFISICIYVQVITLKFHLIIREFRNMVVKSVLIHLLADDFTYI